MISSSARAWGRRQDFYEVGALISVLVPQMGMLGPDSERNVWNGSKFQAGEIAGIAFS